MTDRLKKAAKNRQQTIDAVQEAARRIDEERQRELQRTRSTPKTTGTPLPEREEASE